MKAYQVNITSDPDAGAEVLWAKDMADAWQQAKRVATGLGKPISDTDVTIKRVPAFDNLENDDGDKIYLIKWRQGWRFWGILDFLNELPQSLSDDEFYDCLNKF